MYSYFVRALHHEADSVRAFERIARELRAYGAPEELWRPAELAAFDERDHAERCARIAGIDVAIASHELPVRPLLDFAIDNAREACVGEAYAALVAAVQALEPAPDLRAHVAAIAADEIAHAALAYAIADWVDAEFAPCGRVSSRSRRGSSGSGTSCCSSEPKGELGVRHELLQFRAEKAKPA